MQDRRNQKTHWLAWLVLVSSITIGLCILFGAGIYAGRLGITLGGVILTLVGFALMSGMKFIALPLGIFNILALIFAPKRFSSGLRIVGAIFGLLGMAAGLFFWALFLLSTAKPLG